MVFLNSFTWLICKDAGSKNWNEHSSPIKISQKCLNFLLLLNLSELIRPKDDLYRLRVRRSVPVISVLTIHKSRFRKMLVLPSSDKLYKWLWIVSSHFCEALHKDWFLCKFIYFVNQWIPNSYEGLGSPIGFGSKIVLQPWAKGLVADTPRSAGMHSAFLLPAL